MTRLPILKTRNASGIATAATSNAVAVVAPEPSAAVIVVDKSSVPKSENIFSNIVRFTPFHQSGTATETTLRNAAHTKPIDQPKAHASRPNEKSDAISVPSNIDAEIRTKREGDARQASQALPAYLEHMFNLRSLRRHPKFDNDRVTNQPTTTHEQFAKFQTAFPML
jgi:lipoprotein-anchoring transpeptidase ErfK/SrfK